MSLWCKVALMMAHVMRIGDTVRSSVQDLASLIEIKEESDSRNQPEIEAESLLSQLKVSLRLK